MAHNRRIINEQVAKPCARMPKPVVSETASRIPLSSTADSLQRTTANPDSLSPSDIFQLQRTLGNQAVGAMLSRSMTQSPVIQTKLRINESGSQYGRESNSPTEQNKPSLPDQLKAGIETLSGLSMDAVRVHYNSSKPDKINALAYAQGTEIHLAPGQEQHLPHEAWHLVQQAQNRVKPTRQTKDRIRLNDDEALEHEADVMGEKALSSSALPKAEPDKHEGVQKDLRQSRAPGEGVVQRREVDEIDQDLNQLLANVNAVAGLPYNDSAPAIVTRQNLLPTFAPVLAPFELEVAEKVGTGVKDLGYIDKQLGYIDTRIPTLNEKITLGASPAPPRASAWGGGGAALSANLAWGEANKNLKGNTQERDRLTIERAALVRDRPVAALQDKVSKIKARLTTLQQNLLRAQQWRYLTLLMTSPTVVPVRTEYKDEGLWQGGPSAFGAFIFNGTGPLSGIPKVLGPIEVHIHFKKGSKQINRAHIKSGWEYTILSDQGVHEYDTALQKCKNTIATNEII